MTDPPAWSQSTTALALREQYSAGARTSWRSLCGTGVVAIPVSGGWGLARKVAVVTDSTCDLTLELAEELGVTIVPLRVIFGDQAYRGGVDITTEEFYERLVNNRQLPTTSAPSVGDFQEVYERLLEKGNSIVSIHVSGKLSATVRVAQAAKESGAEPSRIAVVDCQSITAGMGFVVLEAVEAARAGAKLAEVKATAESAAQRTQVRFMLDTLEYLRRGGRIGRARAYLGTVLSMKPILSIREGDLYPEERVRTRARGLERLVQWAVRHQNVRRAAVVHATTPDEVESLREAGHGLSSCRGACDTVRTCSGYPYWPGYHRHWRFGRRVGEVGHHHVRRRGLGAGQQFVGREGEDVAANGLHVGVGRQATVQVLAEPLVYLQGDDLARRRGQGLGEHSLAGAHLDDGVCGRERRRRQDALEDPSVFQEVLAEALAGADGRRSCPGGRCRFSAICWLTPRHAPIISRRAARGLLPRVGPCQPSRL